MLLETIALTTAVAMFGTVAPTGPVADIGRVELVHESHFIEAGLEVDLFVTRDIDRGDVLAEATLVDPARDDTEVDVCTDGVTVWWDGYDEGERVRGSARAVDFSGPLESPLCFTPATAIVCIAALALLAGGGCTLFLKTACPLPDPVPPGGAGGNPSEGGGDGDGDDGSESGTGESGGDEN